jgi:hypothetical protein
MRRENNKPSQHRVVQEKKKDGDQQQVCCLRLCGWTSEKQLEADRAYGAGVDTYTALDARRLVYCAGAVLDCQSTLRALVHACTATNACITDAYGHVVSLLSHVVRGERLLDTSCPSRNISEGIETAHSIDARHEKRARGFHFHRNSSFSTPENVTHKPRR